MLYYASLLLTEIFQLFSKRPIIKNILLYLKAVYYILDSGREWMENIHFYEKYTLDIYKFFNNTQISFVQSVMEKCKFYLLAGSKRIDFAISGLIIN